MLRGQADYLQKHLVGIVTVHKLPEEFRDVCCTVHTFKFSVESTNTGQLRCTVTAPPLLPLLVPDSPYLDACVLKFAVHSRPQSLCEACPCAVLRLSGSMSDPICLWGPCPASVQQLHGWCEVPLSHPQQV